MAKLTIGTLFKGIKKSGNWVTYTVDRDDAQAFQLTLGGSQHTAVIGYQGQNDRSFVQLIDSKFGSFGVSRDKAEREGAVAEGRTRLLQLRESATESSVGPLFAGYAYCEPAASDDDTRPNLNALHAHGGRMVATDGHRLHYRDNGFPVLDTPALLPIADMRMVIRSMLFNFKTHRITTYRYAVTPEGMAFFTESPSFTGWFFVPFVDGQFPQYQQVIPDGTPMAVIRANGAEWAEALAKAPLVIDGRLKVYRFRIGESQVWVEAKDGEKFLMPATVENDEQRNAEVSPLICINADYTPALIDSAGDLLIEFRDELSPLIFRQGPATGVIMPMRA